ncbi:class I SAM-dependent methyltransferase [Polymorphobacter multimanifer]|uniref:Ubiquinone/menaquinone biosynthesis C-methylase UbiE n=1 Tax=Polymorphobacter multimanifer TaxID=1070431 RepID=A0A841L9L3_9SPHN|nr:class I SAM-dependent methyltransferase [Polymorphobacter multimanifer]MBB6228846.1 ubiquinone/menaquinone biosynthesis C-methylase UbiE [Polymorphobacter multimanifer]
MRFSDLSFRRRHISHSVKDYRRVVRRMLRRMPNDRALALAQSIGSETMEGFVAQGDGHVAALRHHGLTDGMTVYDVGCGCGRTAQALRRSGWQGQYVGADVVRELLDELKRQCPGYETVLNTTPTIVAPDASIDLVFHWSLFTHLYPAECYLYIADSYRALKPGGKLVFSFLEMADPAHNRVWQNNLDHLRRGDAGQQLDNFLHRDWIARFARDAGFSLPQFTDGSDGSNHPQLWQALAVMEKPDVTR